MQASRTPIALLSLSAMALVGLVLNEGYTDMAVIPVPGDRPTIGFGSTTNEDGTQVKMGDRTTPPKALDRAYKDVQKYEGAIRQCVKVPLFQYEYDAYADHAYNIGKGAFCRSTLVKKLNDEDYAGACDEILVWYRFQGFDCRTPGNKACSGLWSRRLLDHKICTGQGR